MDQTTTHRKCNKDEKMELSRTHTQETTRNHNPSSMEPPREEAKMKATKHPAKRYRKGNKRDGLHQERDGEDGHGHKTLACLDDGLCSQRAKRHKSSN